MTIYFIRLERDGPLKIGFTAGSAKKRLVQLQTGQPGKLHLLGTINGDRGAEIGLHEHFAQYRINGEWFSPNHELIQTVNFLIKNQCPWYFCRDRAPIVSKLETKIKALEAENKRLRDRMEHGGADRWIRERLSKMALRVRQEKDRADAAEKRIKDLESGKETEISGALLKVVK